MPRANQTAGSWLSTAAQCSKEPSWILGNIKPGPAAYETTEAKLQWLHKACILSLGREATAPPRGSLFVNGPTKTCLACVNFVEYLELP
ncbi:hypothetical protein VTG60DRAFT_1072 [Thermothelomyces hinnuleus]